MQFSHLQFIASSSFYSTFLPIEIILLKVLQIKQIIQRSGEIGLHNYLGLKIALSVYGNIQSNLTPLTDSTVSNLAEKTNGTKYWFMQNTQNIEKLQKKKCRKKSALIVLLQKCIISFSLRVIFSNISNNLISSVWIAISYHSSKITTQV